MSLIPHTTPKSHHMIDVGITGSDVNWILVMYTILWCFVVCDWTSRMYFLYCKVTNLTSKIHWHGTIWKNYTILMRLISDLLDSRLISCLIVTFRSLYKTLRNGASLTLRTREGLTPAEVSASSLFEYLLYASLQAKPESCSCHLSNTSQLPLNLDILTGQSWNFEDSSKCFHFKLQTSPARNGKLDGKGGGNKGIDGWEETVMGSGVSSVRFIWCGAVFFKNFMYF